MMKPNRNKKMMEAINAPFDHTMMRIGHKVDCHRHVTLKKKEVKK